MDQTLHRVATKEREEIKRTTNSKTTKKKKKKKRKEGTTGNRKAIDREQ